MRAVGLHHAALRRALGILDQQAALGALEEADQQDQADDHEDEAKQDAGRDRTFAVARGHVGDEGRELGDDAGHDDQRDAVADTAAGDLFAQPQQEHGSTDEADDGAHAEHVARVDDGSDAIGGTEAFKTGCEEPALHRAQQHRTVARVLVQLLATDRAFLLQRGKRRMQGGGHLHDDRGGDVGHHAERDEAHALQAAAGEHVEHVDDATLGDIGKLGECAGIDARQRHEAEETENDQRADREPDALLELGCLGEIGETDIARETVGA